MWSNSNILAIGAAIHVLFCGNNMVGVVQSHSFTAHTANEVIDASLCTDGTWNFYAETSRCFQYQSSSDVWSGMNTVCVSKQAHLADPRTSGENTLVNSFCYAGGGCPQTLSLLVNPNPTSVPTATPTCCCTNAPTGSPSPYPTSSTTLLVTTAPNTPTGNGICSPNPASSPVASNPTLVPSSHPTKKPTIQPSKSPTNVPTLPTGQPTTKAPTAQPTGTANPSQSPTTSKPSKSPTKIPTNVPTTAAPATNSPTTSSPTSSSPTTGTPTTTAPTKSPTSQYTYCVGGTGNGQCCNMGRAQGYTPTTQDCGKTGQTTNSVQVGMVTAGIYYYKPSGSTNSECPKTGGGSYNPCYYPGPTASPVAGRRRRDLTSSINQKSDAGSWRKHLYGVRTDLDGDFSADLITALPQQEDNEEEEEETTATITHNRRILTAPSPSTATCRSGNIIANPLGLGQGTCWLAGARFGADLNDFSTPVSWPAIAGSQSSLTGGGIYTNWATNYDPEGAPTAYNQAKFGGPEWVTPNPSKTPPQCMTLVNIFEFGKWILDYCVEKHPAVCVMEARCPGSYKRISSFTTTGSSFSKGQCQLCPAGKYRGFDDDDASCLNCLAGYYGDPTDPIRTDGTCTDRCPQGYYCQAGIFQPTPCSIGYYGVPLNATGPGWADFASACAPCTAGYWCGAASYVPYLPNLNPNPTNQKCDPGRCGYPGMTDSLCSGLCPPGYYCPTGQGSACPNAASGPGITYARQCGDGYLGAAFPSGTATYCDLGSSVPQAITPGYYGLGGGGTNLTFGAQLPCTAGSKCINGIRIPCPAGSYQDLIGQTTCKPCSAGRYCPAGSTSSSQEYCAPPTADPNCQGIYYCPAGTPTRLTIPNDNYITIPVDALDNSREDFTTCPVGATCICGKAQEWFKWNNCPNGQATVNIPETYAQRLTGFTFNATILNGSSTVGYTLSYNLSSQYFFDQTKTACLSTVNDGIFGVNTTTGQLYVTRYTPNPRVPSSALQFEACSSAATDLKYTLLVNAYATRTSPSFALSNITCNLTINVVDVNDPPLFPISGLERRVISEKSVVNTPAARCYGVNSTTGCIDDASGLLTPEVAASDEDYYGQSVLYYFFVGPLTPEQNMLKINDCTGLISMKDGVTLRFSALPYIGTTPFKRLTYTVGVSDDGLGDASKNITSYTQVEVYIRDVNDPPSFTQTSAEMAITVLEGSPPGTPTIPSTFNITDEDVGQSYTFSVAVNDGGAFTFNGSKLVTTSQGASVIDFEGSKRFYNIYVRVDDSGVPSLSATRLYTITVLNVNEAPVFTPNQNVYYIKENSAGSTPVCRDTASGSCPSPDPLVHKIQTTDPDGLASDTTTFSLVDDAGGRFEITSGGMLSVKSSMSFTQAASLLNFENTSYALTDGTGRGFKITVRATSDGVGCDIVSPKYTDAQITIYLVDVNEAPQFNEVTNTVLRVVETWPVGTDLSLISTVISATDPDNADTIILGALAPIQSLFFTASPTQNPTYPGNNFFVVQSHPTIAGRAKLVVSTGLIYESLPDCPTLPPTLPSGGDKCLFINIRVTDNGGPIAQYSEQQYILQIVHVNKRPYFANLGVGGTLQTSIGELATYGSTVVADQVGPMFAQDDDTADNKTLTYSVTGGDGSVYFDIIPDSGRGFGFQVYKKASVLLNYEQVTRWTLVVQAQDSGTSSKVGKSCIAGVCDGGSSCNSGRCYETCLFYSNSTRAYSAEEVLPRRDIFLCPKHTDIIALGLTLAGSQPSGLPFKEVTSVQVTITVINENDPPFIDPNPLGLVRPTILTNPTCVVQGVLNYNTAEIDGVDQTIFNGFVVFDEDYESKPAVWTSPYTFSAVTPCDASSGDPLASCMWPILTVSGGSIVKCVADCLAHNYPIGSVLSGRIRVTDNGGAQSVCRLNVTVAGAFTKPDLGPDYNTSAVSELAPIGYVVQPTWKIPFSAIDNNTALPNNPDVLTFAMSFSEYFTLNSSTAQITLTKDLDFETAQLHTLFVSVTTNHGYSDIALVTIPVLDVNEPPSWSLVPDPSSNFYEMTINELSTSGAVVTNGNLNNKATDPDQSSFDPSWRTLTYSIATCKACTKSVPPTCNIVASPCPFTLSGGNIIQVASGAPPLDFEGSINSWALTLRVSDGPGLYADLSARIKLLDVQEPPNIIGSTISVNEGIAGAQLLDLSAYISDPDAADPITSLNVQITGSVEKQPQCGPSGTTVFEVLQGILRVKNTAVLDFEQCQQYNLTLRVTDSASNQATATFLVNVNNIDDLEITSATVLSPAGGLLNCDGTSSTVRLSGTDIGMLDFATYGPLTTYRLNYTRTSSIFEPVPPVFTQTTGCTFPAIQPDNTYVDCVINQGGAGSGLVFTFTLSVAGKIVANVGSITTSIQYKSPTITSVSSPNFPLNTAGGESLTITGTCLGQSSDQLAFGPTSGRDTWVQMCNSYTGCSILLGPFSNGVGCRSTSPTGTTISCSLNTPPGLGASTAYQVRVGKALSAVFTPSSPVLGYGAPTLISSSVLGLRTSGVVDPPGIVITGTNFGAQDSIPTISKLVYPSTPTNFEYLLLGCKVTVAYTQVTCTSHERGVGTNLLAFLEFGGQMNINGALGFFFEVPAISSVVFPGTLATPGGELVTIIGQNFGQPCGVPGGTSCPLVQANYTRGSVSVLGVPLIYKPTQCAIVSDTQIVCLSVAGTGAGHTWSLIVAGQKATVIGNPGTTSYSPPAVGAYTGPGHHNAATPGNESVILRGAQFGVVNGAPITATYKKDKDTVVFTASNCRVYTDHTEIECFTAPGAGNQLDWTVIVDGQVSVAQLSSYGPPLINSVTKDAAGTIPANSLLDAGGEIVYLRGNNFGPAPGIGFIDEVVYGPPSFPGLYDVTSSCTVISPGHHLMSCVTKPGIGSGLVWRMRVRNQIPVALTATASYAAPNIIGMWNSSVVGSRSPCSLVPTSGGICYLELANTTTLCDPNAVYRVQVVGSNTLVTPLAIMYLNAAKTDYVAYDPSSVCPSPGVPSFATGTTRLIKFQIPDQTVPLASDVAKMRWEGPSTVDTGPIISSNFASFTYQAPVITQLPYIDTGDHPGDILVTIVGTNFCESEACCQTLINGFPVDPSRIRVHTHVRITVTAFTAGNISVSCPQGLSNFQSFSSQGPSVLGIVKVSTFENMHDVTFDTRGYTPVATPDERIYVFGVYFGASATVTIGKIPAVVEQHDDFDCGDNTVQWPNTLNQLNVLGLTCTRLLVQVPAGFGIKRAIEVQTAGLVQISSLADDDRFEFLSYTAPVITSLSGEFASPQPTAGGNVLLQIYGLNFGPASNGGEIIFGAAIPAIKCTSTSPGFSWDHTVVACLVPPGTGVDLPVKVTVRGNPLQRESNSVSGLSYLPPSITSFQILNVGPEGPLTNGGQTLQVIGNNFGRPWTADPLIPDEGQAPEVWIGGRVCTMILSSHTEIQCTTPMNEGAGWSVEVKVAGVLVAASKKFNYGKPVVDSITPNTARTDALDSNGNQIVFQITGKNFGYDELKAVFVDEAGNVVVLGTRSSKSGVNTFLPGTDHNTILVPLPAYLGARISTVVTVALQQSSGGPLFSYDAPIVSGVISIGSVVVVVVVVVNLLWMMWIFVQRMISLGLVHQHLHLQLVDLVFVLPYIEMQHLLKYLFVNYGMLNKMVHMNVKFLSIPRPTPQYKRMELIY